MHEFDWWEPEVLHEFKSNNFGGYVASNEELVVLAFRGTENNWGNLNDFVQSLGQWLTNTNFRQVIVSDSYLAHKGFYLELESVFKKITHLLHAHEVNQKLLIITGHSAGGALATLAGKRLFDEEGIRNGIVYSFSGPKVGNKNFADQYPLPLIRVECKNDLVPFFPLNSHVYDFVGEAVLFRVIGFMNDLFPQLNFYELENVQYSHAGQLLYISHDNLLIHRSGFSLFELLENEFENMLAELLLGSLIGEVPIHEKIISMPAYIFDFNRVVDIFNSIDENLQDKKFGFIKHHELTPISDFLKDLLIDK